jgi:ADP-heptose:LPS heptosyltransferase
MRSILERLPKGSRVAVIRLRSLGDSVLTTPALALLKAHRPDLRIGVVVEDRFRAVFQDNPDVDRILPQEARAVFGWAPRLTLNLHGGTRSMALTLASCAAFRAGFAHHRYSFVYSHAIPRAQEILGQERVVHTAEHLASAMFWLGVPRTEIPRASLYCGAGFGLPRGLQSPSPRLKPRSQAEAYSTAVFHPFASNPTKAWPAGRFITVAEELARTGLDPVFLAGPSDNTHPFEQFTIVKNAPLADVKALIRGAQLFIGNDSGPAHIAAAFGVPSVVLFGSSAPAIWGPWRTDGRVLRRPGGIASITPDEVLEAAHSLKVVA